MVYTEDSIERFNDYAFSKIEEHVKKQKAITGLNGCGLTIYSTMEIVTLWYDKESDIVYANTELGEHTLSEFDMNDYLNALEYFNL